MKISEVTKDDVFEYMRSDDFDSSVLPAFMAAAKSFIIDYTAITETELDNYEDLTAVYLVIIADLYDNRNYISDKSQNINPFVRQILDLHCANFLPIGVEEE